MLLQPKIFNIFEGLQLEVKAGKAKFNTTDLVGLQLIEAKNKKKDGTEAERQASETRECREPLIHPASRQLQRFLYTQG
jgi:hypothetical protein